MIIEARSHQRIPQNWEEREKLRDKGQFWTPSWVAQAMVAYVSRNTDLVFDPAAGRGAFLKALLEMDKPHIHFLGFDIDPEVLKDRIYKSPRATIEMRDFIKDPPLQRFDAIVANPPYIRHHRIDERTKFFLRQLCAKIAGFTIDGRAGYHVYFLLQALNLLERNGRLAFILPADVCEGVFAKELWSWIANNFCIECVVTFDEKATPFPNVDTNAVVFFITRAQPHRSLLWVRAKHPGSSDLLGLVTSSFRNRNFTTLEIFPRTLKESLRTGLSRSPQTENGFRYHLSDFARVMRGIATGANDFFFLTQERADELNIPGQFLKPAVGRTKDIEGDIVAVSDLRRLNENGRPTLLVSLRESDPLPLSVRKYLREGEKQGLHERSLIRTRRPWYKMEQREIPPILFAYLGRRNSRFIKNEAQVVPLTGFLCVYPTLADDEHVNRLWKALNHPDTLANLRLVGKSYGSGAIKVEPKNLAGLPIPDQIVEQFKLKPPYLTPAAQFDLFREPGPRYRTKRS